MNKLFGYPEYDKNGVKVLTTIDGLYKNMMMNITVYKMKQGESREFCFENEEMAVLLVTGDVKYEWENKTEEAHRKNWWDEGAWCVHVPASVKVTVTALDESEVLVQSTENKNSFASKFYKPEDSVDNYSGVGMAGGHNAVRFVRTLFDYSTAPYSNMVLGEVVSNQGNWSGYLPHHHPQPEVYYYKFDKPQGFGACFMGEDVFKIKEGSFSAIEGGLTHPQVTAPGYRMYTCWMIRHFEGNPWVDRIDVEEHKWIMDAEF